MTRLSILGSLALSILFGLFSGGASAQSVEPDRLPPQLRPWIDWIRDAHPTHRCVFEAGTARCEWPSELRLELNANEGRFFFEIETLKEGPIPLPGDSRLYPEALLVSGAPAAILERGGVPHAYLPAGKHRVEGRFVYRELPETLSIPRIFGLVRLRRDGAEIPTPRRAENGALWLEGKTRESEEEERLRIEVFRKIEDGNKLRDHTILLLDVGGRARRIELPPLLLEGATPYAIESSLPVRLEADGRLSLQLSAGRNTIEIHSRLEGDVAELKRPMSAAPLPKDEFWVLASDDAFRQLHVEGASPIDPAHVNLPDSFRGLPAYRLRAGESLVLRTERRGVERRPRNELHLMRTLYLDQDGGGYSVRDHLRGTLRDGHRLDLLEGVLGAVRVDGEPRLITEFEGRRGVELRNERVELLADSRIEGSRSRIPASGWSEDLRSLRATLELPPGYLLLGGTGADRISGSLTDRFDLGAIFMIVIVSTIVFRLAGPMPGAISLISLILIWEEPHAPGTLLLFLLFFIALVPELPEGRARKLLRLGLGLTTLLFFMTAMPFAKEQLKRALYPQTEDVARASWLGGTSMIPKFDVVDAERREADDDGDPADDRSGMDAMGMETAAEVATSAPTAMRSAGRKSAPAAASSRVAQKPAADPETVVQMGDGMPSFTFKSHQIRWDGPVSADQELRLFILSPPLFRLLAAFRVLAMLALALSLIRAYRRERRIFRRMPKRQAAGMLGLVFLFSAGALAAFSDAPKAAAQPIPDKELLEQLRARLLPSPQCAPNCIETSLATFELRDGILSGKLIVHAGAASSLRLPGPAREFVPATVRVDGRPHEGIILGEDGFLRLRLGSGVHTVEFFGRLSDPNRLELHLGQLPRRGEVNAPAYQIQGLRDDGKLAEILRFDRELRGDSEARGGGGGTADALEPLGRSDEALGYYLAIERRIVLGVVNEVHTRIRRISPTGSAIQFQLPLLPGEDLLSESIKQTGSRAEIVLSRDQAELSFHSRLGHPKAIELRAAKGASYQEQWILDCDETIVCHAEGLPPTALQNASRLARRYRPLPGESLDVRIERPEPAEGRAVTIDEVRFEYAPGSRIAHSLLRLAIRASRAETLSIRLPGDAKIAQLKIGGVDQPVNFADGVLSIRIEPGATSLTVEFEEMRELGFRQELPKIDLGVPAVNVTTVVQMPSERFILATQGPSWGPAVLFWGKLALILLFAFVLARIPGSPLRFRHYAIVGLGLSSASVTSSLIVIAFFFAMEYRRRYPELSPRLFNLRQIALVFLTFMTVSVFFNAIHHGLLGIPDMQVEGNFSTDRELRFYQDRIDGSLPDVAFFSTKIHVYRLLMLAWALYVASASVGWARWAFGAYRTGGFWKKTPKRGLRSRLKTAADGGAPSEAVSSEASAEAIEADPLEAESSPSRERATSTESTLTEPKGDELDNGDEPDDSEPR